MKPATQHRIHLGDRRVDYRLSRSKAARKLRVRVGPDGVEVVQPEARSGEDVPAFLRANGSWIDENESDKVVRRRDCPAYGDFAGVIRSWPQQRSVRAREPISTL
jgi:predicted metal-dependent hydrolase